MQLAPNVVVAGRFRLNRLLGRGGMGSVWHATHLGLDVPCAVKFIEGEFAHHPEAQTRFEREAKSAAMLRSPHVVQILDHGVWEGAPYIAMELLDGEDLGKRLQQGRLPPAEVVTIITQVCRALSKAHAAGIVHRDLKPDNIFLVKDDDREIAKVLDFGIAKFNNVAALDGATKTGAVLGTPYYMSPEQARGAKNLDSRADLWALAVIVFQCLTGKLPFDGEALGELFMRIMVEPIPMPSSIVSELPPQVDAWWTRAASRDPDARFPTAKEFAESLSMVLGMSQMTDVMDRGQMRAAMQSLPNAGLGGSQPGFGSGSQPGFGATGNTSASGAHRAAGAAQALPHGATQAGMARTFDETTAGLPKKGNTGLVVGGLAAAVVALASVTAVFVLRKPEAPAAAGASAQEIAAAPSAAAAPPPSAPAASAELAAAPAAAEKAGQEKPAPEKVAADKAPAEKAPSSGRSSRGSRAADRNDDHGGRAASPKATAAPKPAANDLGF